MITDHGSQFHNNLIRNTLNTFGTKHRLSTPDHGQSNAVAERAIQTLQEKIAITCTTQNDTNNWDKSVQPCVLAMNTNIQNTINLTPYEMVFGRKYKKLPNLLKPTTSPEDLHTTLIKNTLMKNHLIANELQGTAKEKSEIRHDATHRPINFELGEQVLIRVSDRRRGKLSDRFKGPYKIVKKQNDVYTLVDAKGKNIDRHAASLKKFISQNGVNYVLLLTLCSIILTSAQIPTAPVL